MSLVTTQIDSLMFRMTFASTVPAMKMDGFIARELCLCVCVCVCVCVPVCVCVCVCLCVCVCTPYITVNTFFFTDSVVALSGATGNKTSTLMETTTFSWAPETLRLVRNVFKMRLCLSPRLKP